MDFNFRKEDHTYWLDGKQIPSATEILKSNGVIDDRFFYKYSRDRGSLIHSACQYYAEGDLDISSVDPKIKGYVDAYERAVFDLGFTPKECEKPIFHKTLLYGVTPDQVGVFGVTEGLLELKTGIIQPFTAIQTALQAMAIWPLEYLNKKRIGVELHSDGTYKIEEFKNLDDFGVAISMVALLNWKKQNLKIGGTNQ